MTHNVSMSSLPYRLRIAKEDSKKTYREIAEELGVTERTVLGWMAHRPRSTPNLATLSELARILGSRSRSSSKRPHDTRRVQIPVAT